MQQQAEAPPKRLPHPYLVLGLLTAIYTFNFMDRQVISILAEPIKHDLSLSDTQLGLLGGIFFALFYTTLGIPVAWFADKSNRIRIVAVACTVWSACSMLCGLAGNFTQLALGRIGVGAGEAGGTPPAHSLISDYVPREGRGTALAIYSIGVPLGILLASLAGGAVAAAYGWRAAFLATGAPGILLAVVALIVISEPPRGRLDGLQAERLGHVPLWQAIRLFLANRTLLLAALAAAASAFVGYALNWMPALLIRNKGMNMGEIALWHSLVTGIGSVFGTFVSGWVADRLAARSPGAYGWVPCLAHLISLPLFLMALWAPNWQLSLLFYAIPSALASAFLAPAFAIVQNGVGASQRATTSAILLFTLNMIGLGGGPLFVGMVSDWAAPAWGNESLTIALAMLAPFFLLAAALQYWTAKSLVQQARPARLERAPA